MIDSNTGDSSILGEIDALSPKTKQALAMAHSTLASGQTPPMSGLTGGTSEQPPAPVRPIGAGSAPSLTGNPQSQQPIAPIASPKQIPTLGPKMHPAEDELERERNSGSRISQIHNPWLRGLATAGDAVASGLFPRIASVIPGTEAHHSMVLGRDQAAVNNERANEAAAAKNEETSALTHEAEARTKKLGEPPIPKQEEEGKTITTDQGIMQWNPETKRYDISAGNVPHKDGASSIHTDSDGNLLHVDAEGHATPVTINGQPVKGKLPEPKEGNDFEQYYKQFLGDNKLHDSAANRLKAEGQFAAAKQPPQRSPVTNVFIPTADGGYKAVGVHAGQDIAPGAVTASGMNTANTPTAQTRTMAETAPKVLELADRVGKLVDQQAKDLGPAASRWSEFMAGKVGAPSPEFTKLRTDVALLQTALMRMHVGARGGDQMMEHFRNLIDTSKQSPENLKAALGEIQEYAKAVQNEGKHGQAATPSSTAAPADPHLKEYADQYFNGDMQKAQAHIDSKKK